MSLTKANSRCKALAKSGKPCRAAAMAGGLCFFHANPNKVAELGRSGGRSNRHTASQSMALPRLDSAVAVRDVVAQLIADVYEGRIHPRQAAVLAPLLNLQLRAIDSTDLAQRIAKLEALVVEAQESAEDDIQAPELDLGDLPMPFSGKADTSPQPCSSTTAKPSSDTATPIARAAANHGF